jgi:hypothetical protein
VTAPVVITCNRTRHGQPCTGYLTTHVDVFDPDDRVHAYREARDRGWTVDDPDGLDTCPSRGHDT